MTINVLLVDDQMLVREGIKSLLNLSDDVMVVGEACDGSEVLTRLNELNKTNPIDLILLDLSMPKIDGIATLKLLKQHHILLPVIILTTFDDHQLVLEGLAAGAKGYLLKDVSLETLCGSIKSVVAGNTLIQPAITERLVAGVKAQAEQFSFQSHQTALSNKELEVLRLMACGYSNREISGALFKSEGTIKNHVSNILSKLGVRDRTRAVLLAIENGILK